MPNLLRAVNRHRAAQNGKRLDVGAAVFAIAVTIFWFLSASGKLPPM